MLVADADNGGREQRHDPGHVSVVCHALLLTPALLNLAANATTSVPPRALCGCICSTMGHHTDAPVKLRLLGRSKVAWPKYVLF